LNPLIWTTWKQLIQNGKSQNEIMEYLGKAYKEEQQQQNGDKNSNGIIWRMMTVIACIVMVIGLLLLM
jgi:cytochrome c-type biogenesis protein CcmH/NrfF